MTILSNKKASAIALNGFGLTIKGWKKINWVLLTKKFFWFARHIMKI
jgi:hypothetical protein